MFSLQPFQIRCIERFAIIFPFREITGDAGWIDCGVMEKVRKRDGIDSGGWTGEKVVAGGYCVADEWLVVCEEVGTVWVDMTRYEGTLRASDGEGVCSGFRCHLSD